MAFTRYWGLMPGKTWLASVAKPNAGDSRDVTIERSLKTIRLRRLAPSQRESRKAPLLDSCSKERLQFEAQAAAEKGGIGKILLVA
jgi:hypothetical protein